jgi:outer membrane protein insertion porin family
MRSVPVLLLVPLLTLLASAQTFQPKTITFTGAPGFTQSELLAAARLAPGAPLTPEQVQAATQRLADTGVFTDVRYRSDGQSLTFALAPSTALLPARFVNFPWWTDAALTTELAARVPLFHGSVPLAGSLEEQVTHALEALLADRHITASIEAVPASDPGSSELKAIAYSVTQPAILIGPVTFSSPGYTSGWAPALEQVAQSVAGKEYAEADSATTLSTAALHVYRAKGYAEAAVTSAVPGAPIDQGGKILVPFTLTIAPGEQYRLGSFSLAGSTLVDQDAFLKAALLKPGDIVEEARLRQSLALVTGPYTAQGYIDAKVSATPTFHPEQHLVDYSIRVTPGEPYHMGQLTILQLDPMRQARILEVWALKPGDPFDLSYAPGFLKKNRDRLRPLDGYSASYRQIKHFDTHAVDLEVTFKKDKALGAD